MTDIMFNSRSKTRFALLQDLLFMNSDIFCQPGPTPYMFLEFAADNDDDDFIAINRGHYTSTDMIASVMLEVIKTLAPCVDAYGYITRINITPVDEPNHPREVIRLLYCERTGGVIIDIYAIVDEALQLVPEFCSIQTVEQTIDPVAHLFILRERVYCGQKLH